MASYLRILGYLILLIGTGAGAKGQTATVTDSLTTKPKRDPYNLVLIGGCGVAYYGAQLGVPSTLDRVIFKRFGTPLTFRAMWYPDHRLRIGLETGWTPMYSYQGASANQPAGVSVSAIPVLLVFSMPLAWLSGTERSLARRLSVTGGPGAYLIQSELNYEGRVTSNRLSVGWMAAAAYTQPISRQFRLATEVKWLNATATDDANFSLQLQLVWRAFSW
ncbi:hypothetical protein [Spirosoma knui]